MVLSKILKLRENKFHEIIVLKRNLLDLSLSALIDEGCMGDFVITVVLTIV
jgi:hypothetical protein